MCYEHMLTQDPERLLEDEPLEESRQMDGADERPEPMPDTDPTEPVQASS